MNKVAPRVQAFARKFSATVKPHNSTSPTENPPPYSDDSRCRAFRLFSVGSLTLLLLLSIPTLVLKAYSYSFIESNAEMGFYLTNNQTQGGSEGGMLVAALPLSLFRMPEKLVLVVAMLNILLSMAHLAFVAWDWKAGRRVGQLDMSTRNLQLMTVQIQTRAFRRNILVLHMINAILVLTAFIAMFVSHKASSLFKYDLIPSTPNAVSPSGYKYYRYDAGEFDLETWTCALENAKGAGEAQKDYKAQCDIEVAGRIIMAPLFFVALTIVGVSIWALVVGGKQESRSEHLWTKDVDLEMNDNNVHGKQAQVDQVELDTLGRSERQKDGRLSKIEEDEQEVEDAPNEAAAVPIIAEKAGPLPAEDNDPAKKTTKVAA